MVNLGPLWCKHACQPDLRLFGTPLESAREREKSDSGNCESCLKINVCTSVILIFLLLSFSAHSRKHVFCIKRLCHASGL